MDIAALLPDECLLCIVDHCYTLNPRWTWTSVRSADTRWASCVVDVFRRRKHVFYAATPDHVDRMAAQRLAFVLTLALCPPCTALAPPSLSWDANTSQHVRILAPHHVAFMRPMPTCHALDVTTVLPHLTLTRLAELCPAVTQICLRGDSSKPLSQRLAESANLPKPLVNILTAPLPHLTRLVLMSLPLTSLAFLEHCPALVELNVSMTSITSLVGVASACPHLTKLVVSNTPLTTLDGLEEGCPALTALHADAVRLESLSGLRGCPALTTFHAMFTRLTSLTGIEQCPALHTLTVSMASELVDITPLHACPALSVLDLSFTSVADLRPLRACPLLKSLNIRETNVVALDVLASHPMLTFVGLSRISTLASLSGIEAAYSTLTELYVCYTPLLTSLRPLRACRTLHSLFIAGTPLGEPAFHDAWPEPETSTPPPPLTTIDVSGTPITSLVFLSRLFPLLEMVYIHTRQLLDPVPYRVFGNPDAEVIAHDPPYTH